MIIKRKVDFGTFNKVVNMLDFILMNPEYCPYKEEEYPQELKNRFLQYSMIHFRNTDKVTINFTEEEFAEFHFLDGFSYACTMDIDEEKEVNYVKQLQDKYDDWVKENPEKRSR